jgi:ankyrin repeat protein/L-ascorbate metabolism protein UlaG (beta-lactamase superfamily)
MKTTTSILSGLVILLSVTCFGQTPAADTNSVQYRVIAAVKNGDTQTFNSILKSDTSLIGIKEPGLDESLLHVAARFKQSEMVKILLAKGLDVNAKNKLGSIPLHLACISGSYTMVDDLLNRGSDYSLVNLRGKAPVSYVSFGKNPRIFDRFLEIDKNILNTKTQEGANLLVCAIQAEDTAGFSYLLAKGMDVNEANVFRFTPVCWAVLYNNPELIAMAIRKGANVNYIANEGNTPLLIAVEGDSIATVKMLVEAGAKINVPDSSGLTALHRATRKGNYEIASYLMVKGIAVNSKDENGMTALHYAAIYGRTEIGRAILQHGANPNLTDKLHNDPVFYSTSYGNEQMTRLLVNSGARKDDLKASALLKNLKDGEAVIHYLNHSGYAIETSKHLLVFDYAPFYSAPDDLSLLNGHINTGELKSKKILVFVSHEHTDHYNPEIWKWNGSGARITYVTGFKPNVETPYAFAEPRKKLSLDGVQINTIRSSDAGVGFLAETDGIVVYHPGDHVNKLAGLSDDFKGEIDYLVSLKKKVDIAFLPVAGCGFPDLEVVKAGNFYVVEQLQPEMSFSMHAETTQCAGFAKEVCTKFPVSQTYYAKFPGDRFMHLKTQVNTSAKINNANNL